MIFSKELDSLNTINDHLDLWPYLPSLQRLGLALILGSLVGLEREWRRKEAGFRTFGFTSLIGCLGGMLGEKFSLTSLALVALIVIGMNVQTLLQGQKVKMAMSAALIVTGYVGVLCGVGHIFTPVAVSIVTTALLAWKKPIANFSIGLHEAEIRSAILLGVLAFIIYPILPNGTIDPWQIFSPKTAWSTIIIIASLGFINYILLKVYGRRGVELSGFLGGLVNSTVAVIEMARRARGDQSNENTAYNGVMLATAAMLLRNFVFLIIIAPATLPTALPPLLIMILLTTVFVLKSYLNRAQQPENEPLKKAPLDTDGLPVEASGKISSKTGKRITVESPFSLTSTFKLGAIFIIMQASGIIAQRVLGRMGFYFVSFAGGLISSSSSVASAAALVSQGSLDGAIAGTGAVLATYSSVMVNLPLVYRLTRGTNVFPRLARSLSVVLLVGLAAIIISAVLTHNGHGLKF